MDLIKKLFGFGSRNQTSVTLKARLGEHDVEGSTEALPHEDRTVASIVVHPDFDSSALTADIALLRLQSPAIQRPHIDVVCLPKQGHRVSTQAACFLTGWGKAAESKKRYPST